MNCRMLSTAGCIGLNETYCMGTTEGMKVCPFYKTDEQYRTERKATQKRLKEIGFVEARK